MNENKYEAQERYDAQNTKRYNIKLNRKTDADIIEYLERVPSMQGAIKAALRAQMKKGASE